MKPTTDTLALLAAYRPTAEELDQDWPAADRVAMRGDILATTREPSASAALGQLPRPHRRRWSVAAAPVGAAAAALIVVQILVPGGKPGGSSAAAAVTLERLATAAQNTPADLVRPGQYRHLIDRQSDGRTLESWTAYAGETWRRDNDNGTLSYDNFPAGNNDVNYPSPQFLAGLPTDVADLQTYLRAHVSGSTSVDEAVFVGVGDMLRGGYAPPELRAAALRVLEGTDHVSAQATSDALGRSAVEVSFTDKVNRPGQVKSLFFDPNTSALLQERDGPLGSFTATYTDVSTVDAIPADVIAKAATSRPTGPPPVAVGGAPATK